MFTNKPFTLLFISTSSMIQDGMLTLIKNNKILRPVVSFNMVNMMNNLIGLQISTYCFFHYQSVFKDITFIIKGMVWDFNSDITISSCSYTSLPSAIFFKFMSRFGDMFRCMNFASILMAWCISFITLAFQFSRSKFSIMNQLTATTGTFLSYNFLFHNCIIAEVGGISNL